jgi:hypothetical protein
MPDYAFDRPWSDRFLPRIAQIVGPLMLGAAPNYNDMRENTDLMVLDAHDNIRVAARVRRFGYFAGFGHDVTFRHARASGAETEFRKLVNGFGRYFFYGHANAEATDIPDWLVLDLNRFRGALIIESISKMPEPLRMKYVRQDNTDNETSFIAYDIRTFPSGIIVKCSDSVSEILKRPLLQSA